MPSDLATINEESDRLLKKLQKYYRSGPDVFYAGFDRNFEPLKKVFNDRAKYEEETDTSLPIHPIDNIVDLYMKRTKLGNQKWEVDWKVMGKTMGMDKKTAVETGEGSKDGGKAGPKESKPERPKPIPIRRAQEAEEQRSSSSKNGRGTPAATKTPTATDTRKKAAQSNADPVMKPVVEILKKPAVVPKTTTTDSKVAKVAKEGPPQAAKMSKTLKTTSGAESTSKPPKKGRVTSKSEVDSDTDDTDVVIVKTKAKGKGRQTAAKVAPADSEGGVDSAEQGDDGEEFEEEEDEDQAEARKVKKEPTPPLVRARARGVAKQLASQRIFTVFGHCEHCTKDKVQCVFTQGRVSRTRDAKKAACDHCKSLKRSCLPYGPAALTFDTKLGGYGTLVFPPKTDDALPSPGIEGEGMGGDESDDEASSDEDERELKTVGDLFVGLFRDQRVLGQRITKLNSKMDSVLTAMKTHPQHEGGLNTAISTLTEKVKALENIQRDRDNELGSKFHEIGAKLTSLQAMFTPQHDGGVHDTLKLILADLQKISAAPPPPPQPAPAHIATVDGFAPRKKHDIPEVVDTVEPVSTSQSPSGEGVDESTMPKPMCVETSTKDGSAEQGQVASEDETEETGIGGDEKGAEKGDGEEQNQDGESVDETRKHLNEGEVDDPETEPVEEGSVAPASTAGTAAEHVSIPKRTTRSKVKDQPQTSAAGARTKPPSTTGSKRKANGSPEPEEAPEIGPGPSKKGKAAKKVKT